MPRAPPAGHAAASLHRWPRSAPREWRRHRLRGAGHGGAHPALAFRESGLGAAHSPALHSPSSLHPRFAQDTQPTLLQGCPWPRAGQRAVPGCSCVLTTRSNPAQLLSQKHVSFQSHRSSVPAGGAVGVAASCSARSRHGHQPRAAHQARQGDQGAGPDWLPGAVHAGACGVHGRHQPLHHPQREGAGAGRRRSHPAGVGAGGAAAALSGDEVLQRLLGAAGWPLRGVTDGEERGACVTAIKAFPNSPLPGSDLLNASGPVCISTYGHAFCCSVQRRDKRTLCLLLGLHIMPSS